MSADDGIDFGEVAYREPQRLRRPDRDRRFACLAYQLPGHDDLPIFLDRDVADAIERHALSDTTVELGGILLGRECVDDQTGLPYVWITQSLEARHYENTQASFTYTHDSWEEISRERDRLFPDLDIVGWYHTHPDFGIFLSGHDLFIHNNFFSQPLQVAYVIDPIRQNRGFFVWRGGKLAEVGGYYLIAGRADRHRLARSVDELEGVETVESSAGGAGPTTISPRLEAELMSMLRRSHGIGMPVAADRGQTAAVFTLIGLVLGVIGFGLSLWIASLTSQVGRQADELAALRKSLAVEEKAQAIRERLASVDAKEEALDDLLGEVKVGASPESFVSLYTKAAEERDAAVVRAAMAEQVGRDLLAKNATISSLREAITTQKQVVDQARLKLEGYEKLRLAAGKDATIEDLHERLGLKSEARSKPMTWRDALSTYGVTASGWVAAVLLGLALIRAIARSEPLSGPPTPPPGPAGGPTVRIGHD